MRSLAACLLPFLAVAATGDRAAVDSGVAGVVRAGPVRPGPQRRGEPSELPFAGVFVVRDPTGRPVTRFASDQAGRFHAFLGAGRYRIAPDPGRTPLRPGNQEREVEVVAERWTRGTLRFDTGMR